MSRSRRSSVNDDCKIYVGDLSTSSTKEDIEDAFSYYGSIRNVWVARNPPGFGFVEFEDRRDAEDAVRGFDGREINGRKVRVEMSNPQKMRGRDRERARGSVRSRGRPFNPDDKCYECGGRGHYARDCRNKRGSGGRRRRSYSRSRSRSYDRSRSRSRSGRSGSKSSRSRSNSRSKETRNGKN